MGDGRRDRVAEGPRARPTPFPGGRASRRHRVSASRSGEIKTPVVFKRGAEFERFFEADARRLAGGVRKVGRVEQK